MDSADAPPPPVPTGTHPSAAFSGRSALRCAAWRGRDDVLLVVSRSATARPTEADIHRVLGEAARAGAARLVTGALTPAEQEPYLHAGFTVHDRLHLLRHDLLDLPAPPEIRATLRRARRADQGAALAVDARAFDGFWRLDRAGLEDALRATGTARFRVAVDAEVIGYAVTGRSGDRGYLQRLAVDPDSRNRGIGSALVIDALRWLRRRRATSVVVNTQVGNDGALRLYRELGFVPEPAGLAVLTFVVNHDR